MRTTSVVKCAIFDSKFRRLAQLFFKEKSLEAYAKRAGVTSRPVRRPALGKSGRADELRLRVNEFPCSTAKTPADGPKAQDDYRPHRRFGHSTHPRHRR